MQIKEINVSRSVCFNIGQQYSNEVLVIHFKGLPDLPNKYIYVKKDNYEKEVPLVGDLYVVSRPLTMYSGEVKAQIIARDPGSTPIALTPNFKMMITPSNYSGIGDNANYPDDPNIKNYYVKIDGKIQSMDELIALVQSKLDNGEFVGAQGPKGDPGKKGDKGDPGDVTEEYRNLARQIAQNASDAQASATNAQTSESNTKKVLEDAKTFANQTKKELSQIKTDTSALKDEANTSATNAKASEDKAKEYADNLKESTDAISQNTKAISELADKKITKFYASNQGEIHITDSDNGLIQDLMIYGKSSQDGTPSVENPVEIKSVVNPTISFFGSNVYDYENAVITNTILAKDGKETNITGCITSNYISVLDGICIKTINKTIEPLRIGLYTENKEWITRKDINNSTLNVTSSDAKFIRVSYDPKITAYIYISYVNTYKEQTFTLPYTLNAVPVSRGGNVTIDGQQYIADYIDTERGKIVRKVKRIDLKNVSGLTNLSYGTHSNGVGYLAYSISDSSNDTAIKDIPPLSNNYIGSQWTNNSGYIYVPSARSIIIVDSRFTDKATAMTLIQDVYIIYALVTPAEEDLTSEQVQKLKALKTYYPTTNITANSEQIEGYTVFNYPISLANGWNYVKKQLNDNRDYIYDMDLQSAEAYVNSEYAVTLTELEV